MKVEASLAARLAFLARVTSKECQHLTDMDQRLFAGLTDKGITVEKNRKIASDRLLAERLTAFAARFGRLQEILGDKLLAVLLLGLAEKPGAAIDNLNRA